MSKFTPGPWVVAGGSVWAVAQDGSNLRIAQPWAVLDYVSMGERNANAALIAAAPEMHAALGALLKAFKGDEQMECGYESELTAARAALAKADGKPTGETK